jgi:major membrane immunogen (membrane-anchored lipoprotein)
MVNKINFFGYAALVVVIGFTMIACGGKGGGGGGKLDGTYYNEQYKTTYTFSGDKFTMDSGGFKMEFTYELKDGKIQTTMMDGTEGGAIDYKLKGKELTITAGGASFTLIKQ